MMESVPNFFNIDPLLFELKQNRYLDKQTSHKQDLVLTCRENNKKLKIKETLQLYLFVWNEKHLNLQHVVRLSKTWNFMRE